MQTEFPKSEKFLQSGIHSGIISLITASIADNF